MENRNFVSMRSCLNSIGFDVGELLGKGATGSVYKARKTDGSDVAIKVIEKVKVSKEYFKTSIQAEVKLWKQFNHSHIIRLLGTCSSPSWQCMVMEYSPGDLEQYFANNEEVEEHLGRQWLKELIAALIHLKKLMWVHGDLKPPNILLSKKKSVKVCDFSSVKPITDELCQSYTGTPGYYSPQIHNHEPFDPEKSESWSFGVVAYDILTCGKNQHASPVFRLRKKWHDHIPANAQNLIHSTIQSRPSKRPSFEQIKEDPWISDV